MAEINIRGWRRTATIARTHPDFSFSRHRVAVFVDGCFWHSCPTCGHRPASNVAYWGAKLDRNAARDQEQTVRLKAAGWTVLRFWGHEIHSDVASCAVRVSLTVGSQMIAEPLAGTLKNG